jgi:hypothetical protein
LNMAPPLPTSPAGSMPRAVPDSGTKIVPGALPPMSVGQVEVGIEGALVYLRPRGASWPRESCIAWP